MIVPPHFTVAYTGPYNRGSKMLAHRRQSKRMSKQHTSPRYSSGKCHQFKLSLKYYLSILPGRNQFIQNIHFREPEKGLRLWVAFRRHSNVGVYFPVSKHCSHFYVCCYYWYLWRLSFSFALAREKFVFSWAGHERMLQDWRYGSRRQDIQQRIRDFYHLVTRTRQKYQFLTLPGRVCGSLAPKVKPKQNTKRKRWGIKRASQERKSCLFLITTIMSFFFFLWYRHCGQSLVVPLNF